MSDDGVKVVREGEGREGMVRREKIGERGRNANGGDIDEGGKGRRREEAEEGGSKG